ncbi:probable E3 ubiquitin-protein ligase ATL44 [Salvia splendens]|uniref:probable E3 ubiquitin-protein ligase ATL44 n=1 Tax=Salvia splendens TaxID=180675 RepID=UPI001C2550E9|nr:probable E3 ubiquitin-protein ligase ATL44 [Salvia splendens]
MEESVQSNIYDELDTIMEETILGHVIELERILERPWTNADFTRTLTALTQLATDAASVEEVVNREVAHLGATGAAADQLAGLLPDYLGMLMRAWLVAEGLPGDDGETDECCVCLERLHCGLVATLDCGHEFHGDCIGRWLLRGQDSCPICINADVLLL